MLYSPMHPTRGCETEHQMKIEIELTRAEEIYLTQNCITRVTNTAIGAVPDDYEYIQDLIDLGDVMEPLRYKLADAIFKARSTNAKD